VSLHRKPGQTSSQSKAAEGTREASLNFAEAEKIVEAYKGVLEVTVNMVYGVPASQLLHPKSVIKQSILKCVAEMHVKGRLDRDTFESLKFAYMQLSMFIEDAEADKVVSMPAVASASDEQPIPAADVAAVLERSKKLVDESKSLIADFDANILLIFDRRQAGLA
jgi:hypothetical protein